MSELELRSHEDGRYVFRRPSDGLFVGVSDWKYGGIKDEESARTEAERELVAYDARPYWIKPFAYLGHVVNVGDIGGKQRIGEVVAIDTDRHEITLKILEESEAAKWI